MPGQIATNLFYKTIYGPLLSQSSTPPDSLSVRLQGLAKGTYCDIYGISWGVESANATDFPTLSFGQLQILRNEVFDPNFLYGSQNAILRKDVIWQDMITVREYFVNREFERPFRITDSSDYLIVMPAPTVIGTASAAFNCLLTVRGRTYTEEEYVNKDLRDKAKL